MRIQFQRNDSNDTVFKFSGSQGKDLSFFEQGSTSVFVYGYPFSSSSLWVSSENIWCKYKEGGLEFVDDIEGLYTIIIFNRIEKKIYIITDRYGVYSLFYFKQNDCFVLSDKISSLVKILPSVELNHQSLVEYLCFSFKFGNKTHIKGIYQLEPATIYTVSNDLSIEQREYWDVLGERGRQRLSKEEMRQTFNKHIETAMNLDKVVSFPLSGGIDTRTILSASLAHIKKIHCYTYGIPNTQDIRIAKKITNHFGIDHSIYELDEQWVRSIPEMLINHAAIYNGLIPVLQYLHVRESCVREEGRGDVFVWGCLGDELWRGVLCSLDEKKEKDENVDIVSDRIAGMINPRLLNVFSFSDNGGIHKIIQDSARAELYKIKSPQNSTLYAEWFTIKNYPNNWASNFIKYSGQYFKVFSCMLNKDIVQEIPFIDDLTKRSGEIQRYIICQNNAYLSRILRDNGLPISDKLSVKIKQGFFRLKRKAIFSANKITRGSLSRIGLGMPPRFNYPNWLRDYHRDFIRDILDYRKLNTKNFFNEKELEAVLNSFFSGDNSIGQFIGGLISLEVWINKITKSQFDES